MERICFQVEEAQWFYEDFIRPLDPSLPSLSLRTFSLRIFQHCPLFSEWSTESYTAAFAEFLAYKSRVPVRGAIMLNEEMDEVVLVKGWKKGANWSFPRGKINKDEDDLDCAVREVYEETGFDIRAAGLVKEANEMKYIEVTMREQHMRLYVFRGVPMDTQFEPRTRKEISKIQWYKLNDLPTLKKNKQHEGMGEHVANANKFYMVAPFLVPIKKWISQQRKRESRVDSQIYSAVPPAMAEEVLTDYDADLTNGMENRANMPSDLPEVSPLQNLQMDPSMHLRQLLNVQKPAANDHAHLTTSPQVDAAKSSALLALLRKGSQPDVPDVSKPSTTFYQVSFPPNVPQSSYPGSSQFSPLPFPPQSSVSPFQANSNADKHIGPPTRHGEVNMPANPTFAKGPDSRVRNVTTQQGPAPYRRTGDPEFSQPHSKLPSGPRVPPASSLPLLTSHARTLLDVFNSGALATRHSAPLAVSPTQKPSNAVPPPNNDQHSHMTMSAPITADPVSIMPTLLANRAQARIQEGREPKQVTVDHRVSLLGLFKMQPTPAAEMAPNGSTPKLSLAPVELAASSTPRSSRDESHQQKQLLTRLLQQKSSVPGIAGPQTNGNPHRGHTSATISGPLNQPQFDGITKKSSRQQILPVADGPARSLVPAHKTLFDPNQGVQKKILIRPARADHSPVRSPRPSRPSHVASPKRSAPRKADEAAPFQPQILRRPVTDQRDSPLQSTTQSVPEPTRDGIKAQPAVSKLPTTTSLAQQPAICKTPTGNHKQTLLSLFNKSTSPPPTTQAGPLRPGIPGRISASPPAAGSGIVSPLTEKHMYTRSRLGSMGSIASTGSQARPGREKKQTGASDKAFLLEYLGRIATQEG